MKTPRFVVCEDGSEYMDRFTRFLGDDNIASSAGGTSTCETSSEKFSILRRCAW